MHSATLEQIADGIVQPDSSITYRRADELFAGLHIETLRGWREVTKVERISRRVQVILEDGQCLVFAAGQTFKTRAAS